MGDRDRSSGPLLATRHPPPSTRHFASRLSFLGSLSSMHARIGAFLAAHNTLTLATVGADGQAHACAVFYAAGPDLALYFLSEPKTLHARHIGEEAMIAATIEENNQDWTSIRGLQIHGLARPCNGAEADNARTLYAIRYPFVGRVQTLAGPLARARFYQITPFWFRLIDNTLGFGHKEELNVER